MFAPIIGALKRVFFAEELAQIRQLSDRNDDQAETIRSQRAAIHAQKTRTKEATDRAEAAERSEKNTYLRLSKLASRGELTRTLDALDRRMSQFPKHGSKEDVLVDVGRHLGDLRGAIRRMEGAAEAFYSASAIPVDVFVRDARSPIRDFQCLEITISPYRVAHTFSHVGSDARGEMLPFLMDRIVPGLVRAVGTNLADQLLEGVGKAPKARPERKPSPFGGWGKEGTGNEF